jgi:hypothetical protein
VVLDEHGDRFLGSADELLLGQLVQRAGGDPHGNVPHADRGEGDPAVAGPAAGLDLRACVEEIVVALVVRADVDRRVLDRGPALSGPPRLWRVEDAALVACLTALLRSGPAVRVEEFNGVQLVPDLVEEFLRERIAVYGGIAPDLTGRGRLRRLTTLAARCAELRRQLSVTGTTFYRTINGVSLHKREGLLTEPIRYADVPPGVRAFIDPGATDFAGAEAAIDALVRGFDATPAPAGFGSPFEAFLHGLLATLAEATGSDVAMGRGPRDLWALADGAAPAQEQLRWGTQRFYCCVVPSAAFVRRFADDRAGLVKTLSAYSTRMRYNTWHYWPDAFGRGEDRPGRTDWFFAPTMPDITDWSNQHHTGHVMFGVRHAIRIPIGVEFDGGHRPGLYDLRLMRTREPRYELADLRAAIAVGRLLGALHQTMARRRDVVADFDNGWYRGRYGN